MKKTVTLKSALIGSFILFSFHKCHGLDVPLVPEGMEKCYGISAAGQNDGGGSSGGLGMPGSSTMDCDRLAWRYVPKGTCTNIIVGFTAETEQGPPLPVTGSLTFRPPGQDPLVCKPYNPTGN